MYGHWRMKMQCKSNLMLHYWKSPADLPAYLLSYKVKALNPTTLTPVKPYISVLCTKPISCILLVIQYINPENATANAPGPPASSNHVSEDLWGAAVLKLFAKFLNLKELHCWVLAALEGFSCAITSATSQLYLDRWDYSSWKYALLLLVASSGPSTTLVSTADLFLLCHA
jgi:hypothetical protein